MERNLTLLEKQKVRVYPVYASWLHLGLHFCFFKWKDLENYIYPGINPAHKGNILCITFPSSGVQEPSLSITRSNTLARNTCKISQLPCTPVTVYKQRLASCSWRHRRMETLVTNRLRPEHCQLWPDRYFSSPSHKISLPYKSEPPQALFLPKETYSLNVVGLMANE